MENSLRYCLNSFMYSLSETDFISILINSKLIEFEDLDFKHFCEHKDSAKQIMAMANTGGGVLILGVFENKKEPERFEVTGIPSDKIVKYSDKADIYNGLEPFVPPHLMQNVKIIFFDFRGRDTNSLHPMVNNKVFVAFVIRPNAYDVPYFPLKPVGNTEGLLVRRGTRCVPANKQDIERMFSDRLKELRKKESLKEDIEELKLLCSYVETTTPFNLKMTEIIKNLYEDNDFSFTSAIREMITLKKSKINSKL